MKVLIVSPSTPSSGNNSTARRIRDHFRAEGHECLMCDPKEIVLDDTTCTRIQLHRFITSKSVQGILFLHAFRSGKLLICSAKENSEFCNCLTKDVIRYGVIFGGTDLNVDVLDVSKLEVIRKVARTSQFCVAFTEDLKNKALQLSDSLKVFVQPQAVHLPDKNGNIQLLSACGCSEHKIPPSPKVFLMVTGIRGVKDPIFLLEEFTKWSSENSGCRLLILGPVLDAVYGKSFFMKLEDLSRQQGISDLGMPKVEGLQEIDAWVSDPSVFPILYTPPLSSVDLYALLHRPYVLASVNSSISEGMSSAILEAMSNRVLVIARGNPGNRSVVTAGVTGLIFDTPKEFVQQAERIIHDPDLRNSLVEEGYAMLRRKHSIEKERRFYIRICTEFFGGQ